MVKSMSKNPIIFACANPDPEIKPEIINEVRDDAIIATGRSDYPNQVNNLIGFPYIFRGALDVRAKIINDNFEIEAGFMTTVHSFTSDQRILDGLHSDLRRARTASSSMIPTSTGAAKAVGLVLPELSGKLDGTAIRIPTPNVSMIDFTFNTKKNISVVDVNAKIKDACLNSFKNILNMEPRNGLIWAEYGTVLTKLANYEESKDAYLKALDFKSDSPSCLLYTSPSPRDRQKSRMPSSA